MTDVTKLSDSEQGRFTAPRVKMAFGAGDHVATKGLLFASIPMIPAYLGLVAAVLLLLRWGLGAIFGERVGFREIVHSQNIAEVVFLVVAIVALTVLMWAWVNRVRLAQIFR